MRIVIKVLVALFAVHTVACGAPASSGSTQSNGAGGQTSGGASCDDACSYYLQCKGAQATMTQTQCVPMCEQRGATSDQLSQLLEMDCPSVIKIVEEPYQPAPSPSPSSGGSSGSRCDSCYWDGSSCIWMSPNAPVTPACDADCCPGH
jgi:hypothetical protein